MTPPHLIEPVQVSSPQHLPVAHKGCVEPAVEIPVPILQLHLEVAAHFCHAPFAGEGENDSAFAGGGVPDVITLERGQERSQNWVPGS